MDDIIAHVLNPDQIRLAAEISTWLSALIIGPFIAFAVTHDAGIRCPLAFLRLIQRIALVGFSVALLYLWTFIVTNDNYIPSGPLLIVLIGIFITTGLSALRHSLGPPIPATNTWGNFFGALLDRHKSDRQERVQVQ